MKLQSRSIAKIGRVPDASVFKGTGRHWHEWLQLLNQAGAAQWTHQEIVKYLRTKMKLIPWWQQGVCLGYEIGIGRRIEGQDLKGQYAMTATRTMPLSAAALWRLVASPEGIATWLKPLSPLTLAVGNEFECEGGVFGRVRTMKSGERARLSWQDTEWTRASIVNLAIVPRPKNRSIFVILHNGLPSAAERERLRAHWKAAIDDLVDHI